MTTPTHSLLKRQLKRSFGEGFRLPAEWEVFLAAVDSAYQESDVDRAMLERSLELSSDELNQANSEMRAIFQAIPDLLLRLDAAGAILDIKGGVDELSLPPLRLLGKRLQEVGLPQFGSEFMEALQRASRERTAVNLEYSCEFEDGNRFYEARLVPLRESQVMAILRNITQRKGTEAELKQAQAERLELSRQAGMAEVATGVVHNIGNVLNSINVTAIYLADHVRKSRVDLLSKVAAVLREHDADPGAFVANDPRGRKLPGLLCQLAEHLSEEQRIALNELTELQKNIAHIKDIVAMQQSYAKVSGFSESVQVTDLMEDALRLNASALVRHNVRICREYGTVPPVTVEKHKVLQILINLIGNARCACVESGRADKQLTLRAVNGDGRIRVSVADNGVGIPLANRDRIFQHGFTTRKGGHGFGLHSSALAAKEMGGHLRAESEGAGKGATFTLELPVTQTQEGHD